MTQDRLKVLAEFAAEYLDMTEIPWRGKEVGRFWWLGTEGKSGGYRAQLWDDSGFFEGDQAPLLMHLAQEKLGEEEMRVDVTSYANGDCRVQIYRGNETLLTAQYYENKFIAFWEAVYQAKGGETLK